MKFGVNVPDVNVLYHYCSTATFLSIVQGKSIRLSSLTQSNDWKEGKLVSETFERLAKAENLSNAEIDVSLKILRWLEEFNEGLGFCLSTESDLLSQWRGYADDGSGVAIGFSVDYLLRLANQPHPLVLQQVHYRQEQHNDLVRPLFLEVKELVELSESKFGPPTGLIARARFEGQHTQTTAQQEARGQLFEKLQPAYQLAFRMKQTAFEEEHEWRLLTYGIWGDESRIKYRERGGRLVPYVEVGLSEGNGPAIVDLVLGPKYGQELEIAKYFLRRHGLGHATVRNSSASYR